ncbi:ABC transporter permease [Nitrosococcus oceani]|uniref:Transport permease protein n=2 Tax=Nitrosococcus oceani TaxID=1229 RepID=Q3J7B7_NITOC|nr:ABC transporter permease [Nitrosococcus oceani]KFI18307.1 ABC transporter permease [Nitrosococcus oceani C-27]ABA59279.1 ABC transporter, inner membrane subunit [Nitrosococcus oceani ATCC 19707]EDZ66047.1 ABC-2 type transporter superfamily [Nitrosococcus oceani AFC27]KFI21485.1 ABC transporter permease [Nitrosococcus oceani]GEM21105.1 ABC transporter permease [Nitrosococcus oceani]
MSRAQRHYIAFKTLVIKEVRRFTRIWVQTLLPPAVTMTLYFIIFGSLIGARIGPMEGFSYMEYIAPGLIMMAVITHSYSNVVSSFFSAKFQHYVEELLVSPTPHSIILAGYVVGGAVRGLMVGLLVLFIALFFTHLKVEHPLITCAVAVLTAIVFALGGFINATFANNFDDISIVPNFILTPLTYLGGVFYSINLMPEFGQTLSLFNPILYMVNAFRYGILGVSDINVWTAFALILIFLIGLTGLALYLLHKGVGIRT